MYLDPGCLMGVTREGDSCRVRFHGVTVGAPRMFSAVTMAHTLARREDSRAFARTAKGAVGTIFQHGDTAERVMFSVAYGRRVVGEAQIELIPDAYFFDANGYAKLRANLIAEGLCDWSVKTTRATWRGSSTFDPLLFAGHAVDPAEIPRVAFCREVRGHPRIDAQITNRWEDHRYFADGRLERYLHEQSLWGTRLRPEEMARAKVQIDIDGVANAWGQFEKLLAGSCLLRIASPFMLWYYDRMSPWEHYVPVEADRSDLLEKIEWCFTNDARASEIGAAGRRLALSMTMESESALAVAAMNRASFILPA